MSLLEQIDLVALTQSVIEAYDEEEAMVICQGKQSDDDMSEIVWFIDSLCELLKISIKIEIEQCH